MDNLEFNVSHYKRSYTKRRNYVRRIILVLFVLFFIFLANYFYSLAFRDDIKIEVFNNKLVNNEFLVDLINNEISKKNFYLVNQRKLSNLLHNSLPLLSEIVVRKYLIPECKFQIIVSEKQLWSKLNVFSQEVHTFYLTVDSDLVADEYLNSDLIPLNLVMITLPKIDLLNNNQLNLLKKLSDRINNLKLVVDRFVINDDLSLNIYTLDGFLINVGKIDENIFKKIDKLNTLLNIISEKSLMVRYLDLDLETSAVLKIHKKDSNDTDNELSN